MCDPSLLRFVRCPVGWATLVLLGFGTSIAATHASPDANYQIDPCEAPIRLSFHGLPPEPPTSGETTACTTLTDLSLFDASEFVGDQAALDAQVARAARVTVSAGDSGPKLRLVLNDGTLTREYVADALTTNGRRIPLRRVNHQGGPELSVSVERATGTLIGIDVVDAPVQKLARDIARLKRIPIQHVDRIDAKATATFRLMAIPVQSVLALIGEVANTSLTAEGDGYVFGAVKDYRALQSLYQQTWDVRNDPVKLRATLEKITELAQPNDADDVAVNVADEASQLAEMAETDADYARAEKWRRRQLAEIERHSGRKSLDFASAQVALGRLRLRANDTAEAADLLGSAWQRYVALQPPALEGTDEAIAVTYLQLQPMLAAARALEGDFAGAIALSERMVAERIAWAGERDIFTHRARGSLILIQRLAHQDAAARATLQQFLQTMQTPPASSAASARKLADTVFYEFDQSPGTWLAPTITARWEALRAAPSADPGQRTHAREAAAEVLAVQGEALSAALEYEATLAYRIQAQGRQHRVTQRTAERAIELFNEAGSDGADRIRQLMQSP